jgi:hypothetical protein
LLVRLLGGPRPLETVDQVRAELAATRSRPAQVTRPRRAAHLALQAALLSVGLGFMTVGGCMSSFVPSMGLQIQAKRQGFAHDDLEQGAYREFVVGALTPGPAARLRAFGVLADDLRLADQLEQRRQRTLEEYEARLQAMSPPMRAYLKAVFQQGNFEAVVRAGHEQRRHDWPLGYTQYFRNDARAQAFAAERDDPGFYEVLMVLVTVWPVLWVVWAFACHGGLSFRILGLSLVRADGRPAAGWQCAWRALLVWAPVTALLVGGIWFDYGYWSSWHAGRPSVWLLRLALLSWWAVWPLLAGYVALAVWHPARALHDRLAGTYLVPR